MIILFIIILLIAPSVVYSDSYYDTDNSTPGVISVPYSIDLVNLEYLEAGFTSTEYDYGTDGNTPNYAPATTSMTFDSSTGTVFADVWVYWIYATDGKVNVSLTATDLIDQSNTNNSIKLTIAVDSSEYESVSNQPIIIFNQPEYQSNVFTKDSGTAEIHLKSIIPEAGVPSSLYVASLTLDIKAI